MGETKKEKKENIRNFQDELKLIEFYGKQKNLVRNSGIFRQESAISYIKKFLTTPWHTINAKNVQDALSQAINAYGKNNYQAFESFRQSVEPFTKIMLVASKLISPQDYNYEKISSINDARKLLEKTFDERCFISNTDREILSGYLKDGVELRNKWQHNTPPKDDIETHEMGCTTWLLYVFAVAAICYKIDRAHGGIRFLADCDCKLCFTQPEVNPGKSKTPNVLKGEPCQIDARPGAFQLKITLTDNKGRNHTEMRTGTIERDKYIDIKIKASALGRDGAPRFIPNPLLTGMLQEEKKEGIPFKGGTYEGSLNTRKLPHGMGSFIKEGITYSGRFNNGKAEGPFIVKGDGFEYRGTLSFDPIPWGFDKGEMNIEHAGQKLSYKEATFKGMHCAYGCLHLNGKLLYKGSFEAPATGMIPVIRGCGELHSEDGSIYYGEIDKAAPHGRGCLIDISGKATYTDWFYGEPIGNPQEMILSGDRPACLFDGKRLVCPISGSPFTLHYIGKPVFILRDEEGNTLPCPELTEAREWKYKFNAPAEKPKEEPKAKPEEKSEETASKTKPTEAPSKEKPQGEKKPMETSGSSIKKAAKSIPEEDFFAPKIEPKTNKAQTEKKLSAKKGDNGKYGFVDEKGNWCIYPLFEEIGDFKEGMAKIRLDGQYGFINDQGKTIIPPIYNKAWSFINGLAIVEKNGLYGHINKQGKVVIPIQYKDAYPFQDELDGLIAEVEKEDGSWIFIDKDNKFVKFSDRGAAKTSIPDEFKPKIEPKINKAQAEKKLSAKKGDPGKLPGQGIAIGCRRDESNSYYPIDKYENRVGSIRSGNYITFHEDLAAIQFWIQDPKYIMRGHSMYGFINRKGEWAIPPRFESADNFHDGMCPVAIKKEKSDRWALWGIIDKSGDWILEPTYEYIGHYENGKFSARRTDGTWVTITISEE